jgi:poly(A) polymerase
MLIKQKLPSANAAEIAADRIIRRLQADDCLAYRVGGCVRDRLLGRSPQEVDVATDAPPARVRQLFPKTYAVGEAYGVVIVHAEGGVDVEVATFREEHGYADGRRPASVHFSTPAKDASRRDFTVNALFYDPTEHAIHDYANGLVDLRSGIIRAIGDPAVRFQEDHLRLLRAVRFAAELGFEIEAETRKAIAAAAPELSRISAERVASELTRMLTGRQPAYAVRLLHDLGLLHEWLPELEALPGTPQPPEFHPEGDVWEHTMLMFELNRWPDPVLAWAILLHDVGKPDTHEFRDGRDRFPRHERESALRTEEILKRLKFSRTSLEQVGECVGNHMRFMHVQQMRQSSLRRLIGRPTFGLELELHRLDCAASHAKFDNYHFLLDTMVALENEPPVPEPLLRGQDIMAFGIAPGPRIGQLLKQVEEWHLNGELKTREEALARLREILADG